jgi:hypothetical protein
MSSEDSGSGLKLGCIVAGILGVLLLAGGLVTAGAYWILANNQVSTCPLPLHRELIVIESDADGKATYTVGGKTIGSEAELTAELRRLIPQVEFRRGDGIEVDFAIISIASPDGDSFTRDDLERAIAACEAAGATVVARKKPPPPGPVRVRVEVSDKGYIRYRIGSNRVVESEEALREAVAGLVAEREGLSLWLTADGLGGVGKKDLNAVAEACRAAGATVAVDETVPAMPRDWAVFARAGKRSAQLKVKAVGVRDGELQFRVDDRLVQGNEELTGAVRERIAAIEKQKGGFTMITPTVSYASELVVSGDQRGAVWEAISASGDRVYIGGGRFGYRDGGGRRSNVIKKVKLNIIAPHGKENRYQLGSRTLDGEAALVDALRGELAAWRDGKTAPNAHFLAVSVRVEVKPGVTATEDQIKLAHRTVKSADVERPPKPPASGRSP